ncbi:MAG: glucoamylase family protein [Caldilineaceae bacterium]
MQIDVQRQTLQLMAAATWQSFVALTRPNGLPADHIQATGEWADYTSPTNIGAYLWSALVARDLEIITATEACERIRQTLETVAGLERHEPSGQFYNWYSTETGMKLTVWPPAGHVLYPFLSSVDNGWLATALIMVANGIPELRDQANALLAPMDFGFYYDPAAGLLRGGYWPEPPNQCHTNGYTRHHYGALNTETRIASYIGIARGQIPATHYFKLGRTLPATWAWDEGHLRLHEMQPRGGWKNYLGVDVFEGCYAYMGLNLVPSWGGSMFEALMAPLFVPEEIWGPQSWGLNHPLYVQAQILHGLVEAQYGYWGFSPANNPSGGYREYGVAGIGLLADGYTSNNDNTLVAYGFPSHKGRTAHTVPPSAYTNGVVTPHAVFLALDFAPEASFANLENLCRDFPVYGPWGFWDSVNVETGEVSNVVLALDQGMIMMALGNLLSQDRTQCYFTKGCIEEALRPLLAMETFTVGASTGAMPDALLVEWPIATAREHAFVAIRP